MDVKQAISQRRSIRKYSGKEVSDDMINELLDAARHAPSGNHAEPWRFKVVKDKESKQKLKDNKIYAQAFVYKAPVLIVCCSDPDAYPARHDMDDSNDLRAVRDLSICTGFLMLRAQELGLGTCYVGWQDKQKIKEVLGIPSKYVCPYTITAGFPDEKPYPIKRKGIKDIIIS